MFSASSPSRCSPLAALWLLPAEQRDLRIGVVLYALFAVAVFVVPNALGGNVTRLGALFAGPVLAMVLWPRGRLVVAAVSLPLLYWQLVAPVRDVRKAAGDPATERAYFAPLNAELDRLAAVERDVPGPRSRRPRTAGRPTTWRPTTRSPAAGCASSSPTTSTSSPTTT